MEKNTCPKLDDCPKLANFRKFRNPLLSYFLRDICDPLTYVPEILKKLNMVPEKLKSENYLECELYKISVISPP